MRKIDGDTKPERERKKRRLTDFGIKALKPGQEAWDTEVPGFGVRRGKHTASFTLVARHLGRPVRITIGWPATIKVRTQRQSG